jgi:manganese transport system permease protein
MWMTLGIGVLVIGLVVLFYKELLVSTFDPTMAQSYGLPNKWIHYALMVVLTMVTVASLQTVGIVLVVAMLITPAATAYLLTNRLSVMIYLAALFGVIASVFGLYFSFTYNLASGATIVLVSALLFAMAFFFSPTQGLVWNALKARKNRVELMR